MSAAILLDAGLCLFLFGAAIAAVTVRDLFAAIAFFIVYGVIVAIAWLRLEAVDVALAEAAIGAGLTGVLLIGAWSMLNRAGISEDEPGQGPGIRLAAAAGCGAITVLLALAVLSLPDDINGVGPLVADRLTESGVENPVTAVLLNFRGYDTLLESVVLLIALIAVWSLTPADVWGGVPGLAQRARADGVLATFGRLLPPVGLVIAVYLIWAGSYQPGGAFQAGTVLAAVWLLVVMAGHYDEPSVSSPLLRAALVAGPVLFVLVASMGMGFGALFAYPPGWPKPFILAIEYALTLSIAATLALLVAGHARRGA